MRDPYEILGVSRSADDKTVKAAYRRLARQNHPDLHPGNKAAEERFKDIQAAYDLLGDKAKRGAFDRGEIDAEGKPHAFRQAWNQGPSGGTQFDADDLFGRFGGDDIFADLFGGAARPGGMRGTIRMRGADARYSLEVDFLEAAKGCVKRLGLPGGKHIDVTIPAASEDGQVLRLKGQGGPGLGGGPAGDALIELRVKDHPLFRRQGDDILVELPVTLYEAVLGGRIEVPTIDGPVVLGVPKGSNTGTRLRLKGKGLGRHGRARGDQYLTLKVVLPDRPDPALERLVTDWARSHPYEVRGRERV